MMGRNWRTMAVISVAAIIGAMASSGPNAMAAGSGATVGDGNAASQGMANDPNNAIHAMDNSTQNERSGDKTVTVPALGPNDSKGAGASRTGGVPMGTTR